MKQQSQTNMLLGIGAITIAVIAGYFGLDYFSDQKAANTTVAAAPAAEQASTTDGTGSDYSAAIATATAESAGGTGLTAEEAKRIGEEVARQVAAQVAQSIVDQKMGGGGGGLTEADARRIGEEEGRRVAQEVAAATIQQALASSGGGGGSGGGLTAAEAEQIGLAAGRRAAQQVAAKAARDVVQNEFGGTVTAKAEPAASAGETEAATLATEPTETASAEPAQAPASTSTPTAATGAKLPGADALSAWWIPPASGDFGLVYAGQPKGEGAIALLFSDKPNDGALGQAVKVYDEKGSLVGGSWEVAANPRLAVLRGLQPGRYTVVVDKALADANGKALSKAQHGPIYVI